jgi:hypothetical protein
MPGFYSSHGTTVSFDGVPIGYLTGFDTECKAGETHEVTHVESPVFGTGANARVVKEYDVTSIEPPTLTFTFWGPPSFLSTDAGLKAEIVFDSPGNLISGEAILMAFNHSGRAGQWSTGTATFQLTGALEGS